MLSGVDWKLAPQSTDLLHLDLVRFVGACAVIVTHSQGLVGLGAHLDAFGVFVDQFFLISGFLIAYVYTERMKDGHDYRAFLLRRVARILPLHWATLAAFVILGLMANRFGVHINGPEVFDLNCLPANAALLHSTWLCPHYSFNGPSWSISAEAIMYLAVPAVFVLARRPIVAVVTVASMCAFLSLYADSEWLGWTVSGGALRALPCFCCGALLYFQRHRLARLLHANWLCFASSIALIFGAVISLPHAWLTIPAGLAVASAVAADLGRSESPLARWSAPLGQLTYSLYMLHMLVLLIARYAARDMLGLEGAPYTTFMIAAVLLVFPLSYLSFVLFETPCRRWITHVGSQGWPRLGRLAHEAAT
jgi:peptidoglycan/LPS O-acetylase OafA/YrhL